MYAYLNGRFHEMTPTSLVVDCNGVGYRVEISLNTYGQIEGKEQGKLWIQQIVREDAHTLYGFSSKIEREMFNHLIGVSGIGPNTGRLILSGMAPDDVRNAIVMEDELSFKKVKGVGPKTAKRLIVELKDKLAKASPEFSGTIPASVSNSSRQEALSALIALGFQAGQVQKAVSRIAANISDQAVTEDWIKAALKELSK